MLVDPESQLFARFRDDADMGALGQLYDQTAAELLRVAMHLVADPARAEDLVQQTFVAAIEAADRFDASRRVRAWLLGILTNQARKLQREQARVPEGRTGAAIDPRAIAATNEFTAQVDAAISTLPQVYQPVLVLHLKHGMIAAEMAHVLRRAPGTVRTQLMRALELLKKALPASITLSACGLVTPMRGLDAVKHVVLANAAGRVATGLGVLSLVGGAVLMKKFVVALVLAVLAVVALGAWVASEPPRESIPPESDAGHAVQAGLPGPEAPPAPPEPGETQRELQVLPTHGSLRYRFLWEDDMTPAVGVFVHCMVWGRQNPFLGAIDMPTDHNGEIALSALEPGTVGVYVDRAEGASPLILAGEEHAGTYLIPRGVTVDLTVQDERSNAIPGARVWLSHHGNGTKGHEVGITNGAGQLTIRDIGEARDLAARADGYAPTALLCIEGKPGNRIDAVLTMADGSGALMGIVRTADGRPSAGARVWIGGFPHVEPRDNTKQHGTPPPFELCTDAGGRFHAQGLPAGAVQLQARAIGSGTVSKNVVLRAGEVNQVDVILPAGACVAGFVRDEDGRGIAGARVGGGASYGDFAYCSTMTVADGGFRLQDLPPGKSLTLHAGLEPFLSSIQEVTLQEGERRALDFRLFRSQPKDQIRGTLVDEHGGPRTNWIVSIEPGNDVTSPWSAWLHTDAQGRFVATGCPSSACRLEVFDPGTKNYAYPLLVLTNVKPGADDLRVCVASELLDFASLAGVVVDAEGQAVRDAQVSLREPGSPRSQNWPTEAGGRFRIEQLPARRYEVAVRAADHPVVMLGEKDLLPKKELDLGTIVLPRGGRLALRFQGMQPAPQGWLFVVIRNLAGEMVGSITPAKSMTSDLLVPGRHELLLNGNGLAMVGREFEIRDGETTTIEVPLEPGSAHPIEIREPRPGAWHHLDVVVTDAQGKRAWRWLELDRRGDEKMNLVAFLGVGIWQVEARTDTGLTGSTMVQVVDPLAKANPVVVELR